MPAISSKSDSTGASLDRGGILRHPVTMVAIGLAVVMVVAGIVIVVPRSPSNPAATSPSPYVKTVPAVDQTPAFVLDSTTPGNGVQEVPSDASVSLTFSDPVAPNSILPTLTPMVQGSWEPLTPNTLTFVATEPFVPLTTETISVPATMTSTSGATLVSASTSSFTVAAGGTLRLQQLLATLGYLPLNFTAAGPLVAPQEAAEAQAGTFAWRWTMPQALESLWTQGSPNTITKGAVMAFESQHGMHTDGLAGPAVWSDLLAAAESGVMDPVSYNYVYVAQDHPETTTVYQNGAVVYSTLANTGVNGANTGVGTFPVYERFLTTTMSGTNPDGSKYSDPGIPWVSYFNGGDALHGFVRGGYGFPQSDGCVEMPPSHAEVVYPYTPIGTLVTVSPLP